MPVSIARVQERGQVTIPKAIREEIGIKPGDDLIFRRVGEHDFLASVEPVLTIAEMLAAFREEGGLGDYEAEVRVAEADLAENYR